MTNKTQSNNSDAQPAPAQQPEALPLALECADYATSLRSVIMLAKLEQRAEPASMVRAAGLFERAAAYIAELEAMQAAPPAPAAVAVQPAALQSSILDLEAWEDRSDGEPMTLAETESVSLVLQELKRLRALAAAPAQAVQPVARIDGPVRRDGPLWRAEVTLTRPLAQFSDLYAAPAQELATQLARLALPADEFRGDTASLVRNIVALLDLDAQGCLVPHGVGGHARGLLSAAASRLAAPAQAQGGASDAVERAERYEDALRHIAENAFANKDWTFAQLILNGHSIDAARAAQGGA